MIEDAGGIDGYEFQRLYGMGEALYDALLAEFPDAACRIYAPVGSNRDLLAYLVRRLLENGANSSFVSVAADPNVPIAEILRRPQSFVAGAQAARAIAKFRCRAIFISQSGAARPASSSAIARSLDALLREVRDGESGLQDGGAKAAPLIDGVALSGAERAVYSPIDGGQIGSRNRCR